MKTLIKKSILFPVLVASFSLILVAQAPAQTFTNLHNFTAVNSFNYQNSDGANPAGNLTISGNTLYGTAWDGGQAGGHGTVFAVNTVGLGFTNLHSFVQSDDGGTLGAGLILSGNTLYGTASQGGPGNVGTAFAINTNSTGFTKLHSFSPPSGGGFTNSDGAWPSASLVLSGDTLYGTAEISGPNGNGTVFAINIGGTGFTNLHSFTATHTNSSGIFTNADGAFPYDALVSSGDTLYGTANGGGLNGNGTVFAIHTDGTGFTNLYSFTATPANPSGIHTNGDGAKPIAGLILSGNMLYGTASLGGTGGDGTVFAVNTDGTGFTNLYNFTPGVSDQSGNNSDGANPSASLVLSGDTLYGTAEFGGTSGSGTVFAIKTNGTGFTNLHNFRLLTGFLPPFYLGLNSDGANPIAGLILSGNTLYGTAYNGGTTGNGTVFGIILPANPPHLSLISSGTNVILTWPSSATGWTLQTNNVLATGAWGNYAGPIINNSVTNPPLAGNLFFRLVNP